MRKIVAQARVRAAQADLIEIEYEGKALGEGLPLGDRAEVIAGQRELDYWAAKLGIEGRE